MSEKYADWTGLPKGGRAPELSVSDGSLACPIVRVWTQGFDVAVLDGTEQPPDLRGKIDIFQGDRLLSTALIVLDAVDNGHARYRFKRLTPVRKTAPRDFADDVDALCEFEPV